MTKPVIKLLDLCCGAGGAAMGYYKAAQDLGLKIEITGIDIKPQPNYPFKFIQADAVAYFAKNHKKYTHFHSSPPCQKYTNSTAQYRKQGYQYADILEAIKQAFYAQVKPAIIENVRQAPIRPDVVLIGYMFGLKVIRRRHFELVNWFMIQEPTYNTSKSVKEGDFVCVVGAASYKKSSNDADPKFKKATVLDTWRYAIGNDWMKKEKELAESIPWKYTYYIAHELFSRI